MSVIQGEAKSARTVQPGEGSGGISSTSLNTTWESAKKMELGFSLWYPVNGHEPVVTNCNTGT